MPSKKKKSPKKAPKKKIMKPTRAKSRGSLGGMPQRGIKRKAAKKTVKKAAKKVLKKKPIKAKKALKKLKGNVIGIITHYFPKVRAAVIKLKAPLAVGDTIKIKGHTTDFTQTITSMQIDRVPIDKAKKGDEIGILVNSRARQHDTVSKER